MKFLYNVYHSERQSRRSREGAWIEIASLKAISLAMQGRSREGAWIEISMVMNKSTLQASLPRGSVD